MQAMRRALFWLLIVVAGVWGSGAVALGVAVWMSAGDFAAEMAAYDPLIYAAIRDGYRAGGIAMLILFWGVPLLIVIGIAGWIRPPRRAPAVMPPRQPPTLL